MPDVDDGFDPQDEAEVYDETHRADEMPFGVRDGLDEPDMDEDVYDVTSALGDADDELLSADDYDADDLDALDLDEEEDEDDNLDDDLEDEPDHDYDGETDHEVDRAAGRAAPDEPGLAYTDDLDRRLNPRDSQTKRYESARPLSDEQLAELGYLPPGKETER